MHVGLYRNDLIKGKMSELGLKTDSLNENPNTITRIRKGKDVKISTLVSVTTQLGLTMAEIFTPKPQNDQGSR